MNEITNGVVVRTIKVAGTHPRAHIHEIEAYPKDGVAPAGMKIRYEDCKAAAGAFDVDENELREIFTVEGNHIIRVGWPGPIRHFRMLEQGEEILFCGDNAVVDRDQIETSECQGHFIADANKWDLVFPC